MPGQAEISLLPAATDDVANLLGIHLGAFESDQFSNLMLLGRDPDVFKGLIQKSIEAWMSDPKAQMTKAVAANGVIVGYACWITEDAAPEEVKPTTAPTKLEPVPKIVDEQAQQQAPGPSGGSAKASAWDAPDPQPKLLPQDLGKLMRKDLMAHKNQLVGNQRHMVLQALVTDPEWQNRGIGARLVQWGTKRADAEGVACWAHASPSGYGVYLRAGFAEMGASEYELNDYLPEDERGKSAWGTYTFRYMVRKYDSGA